MSSAIVDYNVTLPEISDRLPWLAPDCYLVKDAAGGWRIVEEERRPTDRLLVAKLRTAVQKWRGSQYQGASDVTRRLFEYWFDEDHEVWGFPSPFRFYFGQREAIETLAYLVEIFGKPDVEDLIRSFATLKTLGLPGLAEMEFQTTMDGERRLRRPSSSGRGDTTQQLPPRDLRRYAFKLATGSGKTWIMAMTVVWSYFHKLRVAGSPLSTNFLILAPNVIVYQRLERDFANNQIFNALPLIPPEWRPAWQLKPILRGDSTEPDAKGNLFLTNVQQLQETTQTQWTPANAIEALLGRKPTKDLASSQRSMLERLRSLPNLVAINDEAHHVHDTDLAWTQSLLSLNDTLPEHLALWLDFSATPKYQTGEYFPWTVCDYPLAQAVEDRIVKTPLIVNPEDGAGKAPPDPDDITAENVAEKFGYWIQTAIDRLKQHTKAYAKLNVKPVLFIMAEKSNLADAIGRHLRDTQEYGFTPDEVLVIHTDTKGEVTKADLDLARKAARDVDAADSKVRVIVSVMMLREGWDVRNVSIVLGLRPFSAKAEILPEQVIGRGLRLIASVSPDRTQTLEVLGTENLLRLLREQLEAEGVGFGETKSSTPPTPIIVEPLQNRLPYDVAIPLSRPVLVREVKNLSKLDPLSLAAVLDQADPSNPLLVRARVETVATNIELGTIDINTGEPPLTNELLASITNQTLKRAGLTGAFAQLFPHVRTYVARRCYGKEVDLDNRFIRFHLQDATVKDLISRKLATAIGQLTVERRDVQFEKPKFKLSETKPFLWRRDLNPEPLACERTVFNYVATYNGFERKFGQFLDKAPDVLRFSSLGTTMQGDSGTAFRIDYLKSSGAIGFYHPDWVVVQHTPEGEINWIVETKGRVWEDTVNKDEAMQYWCKQVSDATNTRWQYLRVDQGPFEAKHPAAFLDLIPNLLSID